MIRDRIKKAVRKVAIKAFNMEFDTEERDPRNQTVGTVGEVDMSVIPKLVDGDGDTPGPNHKTDIGRTWVSAQLVGGVPPYFIDIRPPLEVAAGRLPGAILLPGESVLDHLDRLPEKEVRVTIYDQTGQLGSEALAEKLRAAGWEMARRLQGGYAEWIEHDEPIEVPPLVEGARYRVGDPVRLATGQNGWVQEVTHQGGGVKYAIWLDNDTEAGPVGDDDFAS